MGGPITRDMVQGFLDGLTAAGIAQGKALSVGTPAPSAFTPVTASPARSDYVSTWLANHPTYPQDSQTIAAILTDLVNYRGGQ